MKEGDLINCYHIHNIDGKPDFNSFFSDAILVKKLVPTIDIPVGFELWEVNMDDDNKTNTWLVTENDVLR